MIGTSITGADAYSLMTDDLGSFKCAEGDYLCTLPVHVFYIDNLEPMRQVGVNGLSKAITRRSGPARIRNHTRRNLLILSLLLY